MVAMWSEADGEGGFLIRPDGELLPIGDYQSDANHLTECDKTELANIYGNLMKIKFFENEYFRTLTLTQIQWVKGKIQEHFDGCILQFSGTYNKNDFNNSAKLIKTIKWRSDDSKTYSLKAGTEVKVNNRLEMIDPNGNYGMTLSIPQDLIDFKIPSANKLKI